MHIKDKLLKLLFYYSPEYITADSLALRLGISRSTVLRYIRNLRNEGHKIYGCTNRGFSLQNTADDIIPFEISKFYPVEPEKIRIFSSLPSTNATAKEMAGCGAPEGTILIAEKQTHGRGRLGRKFYSPAQSGLYMSIILRPSLSPNETLLITTLAAVAVAESIDYLTNETTQIKWVNDIYLHNKKVAGILTEASVNPNTQKMDYVVLGIGINVYKPQAGFPPDLSDIAGAVYQTDEPQGRVRLIASVLQRFDYYYKNIKKKEFFSVYAEKNLLMNQNVLVIQGDNSFPAKVIGLNDDFSLKLLLPDGEITNLLSGELSVRPIKE